MTAKTLVVQGTGCRGGAGVGWSILTFLHGFLKNNSLRQAVLSYIRRERKIGNLVK